MARSRSPLPAEIRPEDITVIVDSREQTPFDMAPLKSEIGTLTTGDYSVKGLERFVVVERKSLQDIIACVGVERERFDREMHRILAYPARLLVIESSWYDIQLGEWRSKVTPQSAMGSLIGWMVSGIPIVMSGDHLQGGKMVQRFLFIAARRRWREARSLATNINETQKKGEEE